MMRWMILTLVCQLLAALTFAQDGADRDAAARSPFEGWQKFYAQRAAQYEISSPGDKDARYKLHPSPLLTYTNPVRGRDQHGAVFAWTRGGKETADRPEFLGTVWSISASNSQPLRRTSHEVHSLASSPLHVECPAVINPDATSATAVSWTLDPIEESLRLPAESTQRPAATPPRRFLQMRSIAGDLEAKIIERSDGTERPLRLMPSPLMRYAGPEDGVIDGCIFAFVLATDPELLVLIEAIDGASGEPSAWRLQPARFTGTAIRLAYQKQEIWRCENINYSDQTGPYRLRMRVTELPESID